MSSSFIKNVKLTGFIQLFLFSGSYESCSEVNKVLKDIFGMLFLFFVYATENIDTWKLFLWAKLVNKQCFDHTLLRTVFDLQLLWYGSCKFWEPLHILSCVSITESIFLIRIKPAKGSLMKGMFGRHPIKSAYHFSYLWA